MSSSFKVMLAHAYNPLRIDSWRGVTVEPKVDGVRVIVLVDNKGVVTYHSRNGRKLHMFNHLSDQFRELKSRVVKYFSEKDAASGVMFDGEMTAATFGDIAGAIHRKGHTARDAKFLCFHAMPMRLFQLGVDCLAQKHRMEMLEQVVTGFDGIRYNAPIIVDTHNEVMATYHKHRRRGHEGTMVKLILSPWIASRSRAWMKIKGEETLDLKVVGIKEGTGKYTGTCGAIIVDHKGVEVPISGMLDAARDIFWRNRNAKDSIIGKIVEVEFQEVTTHGSLRHPRFKRIREDK